MAFKLINFFQSTLDITKSLMHPPPAKIANDRITTYTTLQLVQADFPSFVTFAAFLVLIIIFVILTSNPVPLSNFVVSLLVPQVSSISFKDSDLISVDITSSTLIN